MLVIYNSTSSLWHTNWMQQNQTETNSTELTYALNSIKFHEIEYILNIHLILSHWTEIALNCTEHNWKKRTNVFHGIKAESNWTEKHWAIVG